MKKFISFFFGICIVGVSLAQTKKETEDWLAFYLNKFHGHTTNIINGQGYIDSYLFQGHSMVQSTYNILGDSASWKVVHIDLSRVIKVEIFVDSNAGAVPTIPCFKIWLYFQAPQYAGDISPVTMNDMNSGLRIHYSYTDLYELDFGDYEILEDKMPSRLKKAVEHLITLNRGPLVKDVF
jgi:hypothetical protein